MWAAWRNPRTVPPSRTKVFLRSRRHQVQESIGGVRFQNARPPSAHSGPRRTLHAQNRSKKSSPVSYWSEPLVQRLWKSPFRHSTWLRLGHRQSDACALPRPVGAPFPPDILPRVAASARHTAEDPSTAGRERFRSQIRADAQAVTFGWEEMQLEDRERNRNSDTAGGPADSPSPAPARPRKSL